MNWKLLLCIRGHQMHGSDKLTQRLKINRKRVRIHKEKQHC